MKYYYNKYNIPLNKQKYYNLILLKNNYNNNLKLILINYFKSIYYNKKYLYNLYKSLLIKYL